MNYNKECRLGVGSTAAAAKDFRHIVRRYKEKRKIHDAILRGSFRGALATAFLACLSMEAADNIIIPFVVAVSAAAYAAMYAIINRKAVRL